ncbi:hypothetical protein K474DRAFT_1668395 [Panus rudis PR-1116 ss-1]|nr:hypothetical protein K474DRAFT_1668395 [Panus rudis PR-1116 ss-1]
MALQAVDIPGTGGFSAHTGENLIFDNARERARSISGKDFYRARTARLQRTTTTLATEELRTRVLNVLDYMDKQDLNLPLLLWELFWNNDELYSDDKARYARTELMLSEEFEQLLRLWHKPTRFHNKGVKTRAAYDVLETFVKETLSYEIDDEMKKVANAMHSPQEDLSEQYLLSIKWEECIAQVQVLAPRLWGLLRHAAYTPQQDERNSMKSPDSVCDPLAFFQNCIDDINCRLF